MGEAREQIYTIILPPVLVLDFAILCDVMVLWFYIIVALENIKVQLVAERSNVNVRTTGHKYM